MVLAPEMQVLLGLLIVSALMTVLWLVQRRTGNAGIVDAGWAAGIGILGVFFAATSDGYLPRRVLVGRADWRLVRAAGDLYSAGPRSRTPGRGPLPHAPREMGGGGRAEGCSSSSRPKPSPPCSLPCRS